MMGGEVGIVVTMTTGTVQDVGRGRSVDALEEEAQGVLDSRELVAIGDLEGDDGGTEWRQVGYIQLCSQATIGTFRSSEPLRYGWKMAVSSSWEQCRHRGLEGMFAEGVEAGVGEAVDLAYACRRREASSLDLEANTCSSREHWRCCAEQ